MDGALDKRIGGLAGRQRGYVSWAQLLALGLGPEAIRYRVTSGRLIRVYPGVYAVGHLPTLTEDRAVGALLACGLDAVLSHGSAAVAWGIFRRWRMPFEVTARSVHKRRGIRVHRARLKRRDTRYQIGIRVTSPARTLLDVARRTSEKRLRRAVNDLRGRGYLHVSELEDVIERFPRHPGAARLRPFVERPRDRPTRSDLEDRFLAFTERFGLPRPEVNVWVAGREADVWFPGERLIVELDGWDFHCDRDSFEEDRENDTTALALGIATCRFTDTRLTEQPEIEAERLWAILRTRRAA